MSSTYELPDNGATENGINMTGNIFLAHLNERPGIPYYTRITNRSGQTRHFGFIPPHGKTLTNNEYTDVRGEIDDFLNPRELKTLTALADDMDIEVDYRLFDYTVHDASPLQNHGTGRPTNAWADILLGDQGLVAYAPKWTGTGGGILTPKHASYDVGGQLSVQAWIKIPAATAIDGRISITYDESIQFKWYCEVHRTGGAVYANFNLYTVSEGETWWGTGPVPNLGDGAWHHLVWVYDKTLGSNRVKIYYDGSLGDQTDGPSSDIVAGVIDPAATMNGLVIAEWWDYFYGLLDEIAVWNRPLSSTEVATIYAYQSQAL